MQTLNLQFPQKNVLHCKYLLISLCSFWEYLLQNTPQRKKVTILKFATCYIAIHFQPLQLVRLNN